MELVSRHPPRRRRLIWQSQRRKGSPRGPERIVTTSCDDDADRQRHLASERAKEELTLLTNMAVAGPEIARRIRERIQSDGSVIIIKDELLSSFHAMPSNVPWMASCSGAGLSITLGYAGDIRRSTVEQAEHCHV